MNRLIASVKLPTLIPLSDEDLPFVLALVPEADQIDLETAAGLAIERSHQAAEQFLLSVEVANAAQS